MVDREYCALLDDCIFRKGLIRGLTATRFGRDMGTIVVVPKVAPTEVDTTDTHFRSWRSDI